jgi:hypothetical protein
MDAEEALNAVGAVAAVDARPEGVLPAVAVVVENAVERGERGRTRWPWRTQSARWTR